MPPATALLSEKLSAAMKRAGYENARQLGIALGMGDGSLVGKWLSGKPRRITSETHLENLPRLLGTPADYFRDPRTNTALLEELQAGLAAERQRLDQFSEAVLLRLDALEEARKIARPQSRRPRNDRTAE